MTYTVSSGTLNSTVPYHTIGGMVVCGPWKKTLDFDRNLDRISLGLG